MTAKNDVTGDAIKSKVNSEEYRNNWDAIFGKKEKTEEPSSKEETKNDQS